MVIVVANFYGFVIATGFCWRHPVTSPDSMILLDSFESTRDITILYSLREMIGVSGHKPASRTRGTHPPARSDEESVRRLPSAVMSSMCREAATLQLPLKLSR